MILTNQYNLPTPLVEAVRRDEYDPDGDISATGLIQPPQMRYLEAMHANEITEDASEGIYRLLGKSVHEVLRAAGDDQAIHEERLAMTVNGWRVTGQTDRYEHGAVVRDFKVTSVYSFLLGDKPEWAAQLNIYGTLWRLHGFPVERLEIIAILRDWMKRRSLTEKDYPPAPALVKEVPLWSHEKCVEYIRERVRLHQKAMRQGEYPPCTPEERWVRPDQWAVKKKGNKTAVRVLASEHEAELWIADQRSDVPIRYAVLKAGGKRALKVFDTQEEAQAVADGYTTTKDAKYRVEARQDLPEYEIEFRTGESVRCAEGYCRVAQRCRQAKELGINTTDRPQEETSAAA